MPPKRSRRIPPPHRYASDPYKVKYALDLVYPDPDEADEGIEDQLANLQDEKAALLKDYKGLEGENDDFAEQNKGLVKEVATLKEKVEQGGLDARRLKVVEKELESTTKKEEVQAAKVELAKLANDQQTRMFDLKTEESKIKLEELRFKAAQVEASNITKTEAADNKRKLDAEKAETKANEKKAKDESTELLQLRRLDYEQDRRDGRNESQIDLINLKGQQKEKVKAEKLMHMQIRRQGVLNSLPVGGGNQALVGCMMASRESRPFSYDGNVGNSGGYTNIGRPPDSSQQQPHNENYCPTDNRRSYGGGGGGRSQDDSRGGGDSYYGGKGRK
jgi:hypothetical protein